MFKFDEHKRKVLFTYEDRDLAIALTDIEGFNITTKQGTPAIPLNINGKTILGGWCKGVEPEQEMQGVFFYHIRKRKAS